MEAFLLTLREPITRGAQEKPDVVEGIACASAVTGRVLLDAAASLTWGIAGELDDVTGVEDAGGRVSVRLCTGTDLQVCGEPVGVGHG